MPASVPLLVHTPLISVRKHLFPPKADWRRKREGLAWLKTPGFMDHWEKRGGGQGGVRRRRTNCGGLGGAPRRPCAPSHPRHAHSRGAWKQATMMAAWKRGVNLRAGGGTPDLCAGPERFSDNARTILRSPGLPSPSGGRRTGSGPLSCVWFCLLVMLAWRLVYLPLSISPRCACFGRCRLLGDARRQHAGALLHARHAQTTSAYTATPAAASRTNGSGTSTAGFATFCQHRRIRRRAASSHLTPLYTP